LGLAELADLNGDRDLSLINYQTSLALFEKSGDNVGAAYCLMELGFRKASLEASGAAFDLFDRAKDLFCTMSDFLGIAYCLRAMACSLSDCGNQKVAKTLCYDACSMFIELGFTELAAKCHFEFGLQSECNRDFGDAKLSYENAVDLFKRSFNVEREYYAIDRIFEIISYRDDIEVDDVYRQSLAVRRSELSERVEKLILTRAALMKQGDLAIELSHFDDANRIFSELRNLFCGGIDEVGEARCLSRLGRLALCGAERNYDVARAAYGLANRIFSEKGEQVLALECRVAMKALPSAALPMSRQGFKAKENFSAQLGLDMLGK